MNRIKKLLVVLIASFLLVASVGAVAENTLPSPGILPDSPFYGFKRAFEGINGMFAFTNQAKVEHKLRLAEKRLAEARAMSKKGKPEYVNQLSEDYKEQLDKANEIASTAGGFKKERLAKIVAEVTSQHLEVLDKVKAEVPEKAKEKIELAKNHSIRGNKEALRALAGENPEEASRIAMKIAKNRIKKVEKEFEKGKEIEGLLKAREYKKYVDFGKEISEIARSMGKKPSEGQEIIANATSQHLEIMDRIQEKIPEQARKRIQNIKNKTIKASKGALKRLAKENPEKTARIAMRVAETRLKRIKENISTEEVSEASREFREYTQLGQEISAIAEVVGKNTSKVEELIKTATSHHIEVLESVFEKVPSQAKRGIRKALNQSKRTREVTEKALRERVRRQSQKNKTKSINNTVEVITTTPATPNTIQENKP